MIDFRYHLVSLISVFIALAVGIVLGAGPLRDTISDQISGQVEVLRAEKDALRGDLEKAQAQLADDDAFITAAAPDLLADLMPEHRVAIVRLPGASNDVVNALTTRIDQAGADVVSTVSATTMWAEPDQNAFRARVADSVETSLTEQPDAPGDDAILAAGLAVALTQADASDPRKPSAEAVAIMAVLTDGDEPLIEPTTITASADLVLIVTAAQVAPAPDATPDPSIAPLNEGWVRALSPLAAEAPSVVVGYAAFDNDLVVALRGNGSLTTVDGAATTVGQVTAVLALAAAAADEEPAAYGSGIGATVVLPPRSALEAPKALQPVEVPTTGATPEGTDADGSDAPADGTTPDGTAPDGTTPDGTTPETPGDGETSALNSSTDDFLEAA